MKKWVVFLGLAFVLLAGFVVAINQADAANLIPIDLANPGSSQVETPTTSPSPEQDFQELENKAQARIGEGWLYTRSLTKFDVDPFQEEELKEGFIPLVDTTSDHWRYVNASGYVERFVNIVRTMDGAIQQVGIYSDGTAWNTMVDEIVVMEPFRAEPFDYGLPYGFKRPDFKSQKIVLENGLEAVLFTFTVKEEKPYKSFDYPASAPVVSKESSYVFDAVSGFFISKTDIFRMEDGTQRVFLYLEMKEIIFNAKPPSDVLAYFELKKQREEQK